MFSVVCAGCAVWWQFARRLHNIKSRRLLNWRSHYQVCTLDWCCCCTTFATFEPCCALILLLYDSRRVFVAPGVRFPAGLVRTSSRSFCCSNDTLIADFSVAGGSQWTVLKTSVAPPLRGELPFTAVESLHRGVCCFLSTLLSSLMFSSFFCDSNPVRYFKLVTRSALQ